MRTRAWAMMTMVPTTAAKKTAIAAPSRVTGCRTTDPSSHPTAERDRLAPWLKELAGRRC